MLAWHQARRRDVYGEVENENEEGGNIVMANNVKPAPVALRLLYISAWL